MCLKTFNELVNRLGNKYALPCVCSTVVSNSCPTNLILLKKIRVSQLRTHVVIFTGHKISLVGQRMSYCYETEDLNPKTVFVNKAYLMVK